MDYEVFEDKDHIPPQYSAWKSTGAQFAEFDSASSLLPYFALLTDCHFFLKSALLLVWHMRER